MEGVVAYTKEGPTTIAAKVTVDASGDADVVAMAGFRRFRRARRARAKSDDDFPSPRGGCRTLPGQYGEDTIMGEAVSALIREKSAGNEYKFPGKDLAVPDNAAE